MLNQAAFISHTHPYLPDEQIEDLRCYDDPSILLPDPAATNHHGEIINQDHLLQTEIM